MWKYAILWSNTSLFQNVFFFHKMITQLFYSPSHLSYEDTYNTLKYADRAKHIRANVSWDTLHYSCFKLVLVLLVCFTINISSLTDKASFYLVYNFCLVFKKVCYNIFQLKSETGISVLLDVWFIANMTCLLIFKLKCNIG